MNDKVICFPIPSDGSRKLAEMSEAELHKFFYETVTEDFYTAHEVSGVCLVNHPNVKDVNVRADFLLYPRQHLLDAGFVNTWFAVEIKRSRCHIGNAMRQAFWYTLSQFDIKGKTIAPGFAVAWVPKGWSASPLWDAETKARNEGFAQGECHSFGYLNVGWMRLQVPQYSIWEINFYGGGETYSRRYHPDKGGGITVSKTRKRFYVRAGSGSSIAMHSGLEGEGA